MPIHTTPEIEAIRQQIEKLKAELTIKRHELGTMPVEDVTLTQVDGSKVKLSELFGDRNDLIAIHNMGQRCDYCTLWADGFRGFSKYLSDRAAFVLVSADPWETVRAISRGRGWEYKAVSGYESPFNQMLGFEEKPGDVYPGVSAFHKNDDGSIVLTGQAIFGPGDDFCAVWPMFDLLLDGPNGWEPKKRYD